MPSRASNITEFADRLSRFVSEAGLEHAEAFRPRSSDVIIATYPKAGTTWMQQITHGLRSGGDMSFEEITEVTPWIELAYDLGWDLDADQAYEPRIFKSHWNAMQVPPGCRYIAVLRDPIDTMLSFYDFMNGWILERDQIPLDEFVAFITIRDHHAGDYWSHLSSWWKRRAEPCVFLTTFEEMKQDLRRVVSRIASFMGTSSDPSILDVAARQSEFAFMKAHEPQFDDHLIAAARNLAAGVPAEARSTKVHKGEVRRGTRAHARLSPSTLQLLDARWAEIAAPATGCSSYAELLGALRAETQMQRPRQKG